MQWTPRIADLTEEVRERIDGRWFQGDGGDANGAGGAIDAGGRELGRAEGVVLLPVHARAVHDPARRHPSGV